MNKVRAKKYIELWLKSIETYNIDELEKDIGMPLVDFLVELLNNMCEKYKDFIYWIPVDKDSYSTYIIAPKNNKYSLEDFFLNRLMRSVEMISYTDTSYHFSKFSEYDPYYGAIDIDKCRIQESLEELERRKKLVAHEFLHALKTQFVDGDFFNADKYCNLRTELEKVFPSEINKFNIKHDPNNGFISPYIHCGINYSSRIGKQINMDKKENLDEILNELDAISFVNDNYKDVHLLDNKCIRILRNPESSNTHITNYAYILRELIDDERLFESLYLDPVQLGNEFNNSFSKIFQKEYNNNEKAYETFNEELSKIKKDYSNSDIHLKLLNTLYECASKKFPKESEKRRKAIKALGFNGIIDVSDKPAKAFSQERYADEYNLICQEERQIRSK